jgi:hypothetical protein
MYTLLHNLIPIPSIIMLACATGEHTAPAGLLGTFAGALLSGCREAARAIKLLKSSGPVTLEVHIACHAFFGGRKLCFCMYRVSGSFMQQHVAGYNQHIAMVQGLPAVIN